STGRPRHNEKPRLHPKMQTGSFMLSPLARLLHLRGKRGGSDFVPAAPGILLVEFVAGSAAIRFRLNARTRRGRIRSARWPGSSRNTLCARVRTSAGYP